MKMEGVVVGLAAMLASCATPYQEKGFAGGVSATQIDAQTIIISGIGNGFTSDHSEVRTAEGG